jgi:hypothetical protein
VLSAIKARHLDKNYCQHEFDERFFVGAGCARPNKKPLFENCGASHRSSQTTIIGLTL